MSSKGKIGVLAAAVFLILAATLSVASAQTFVTTAEIEAKSPVGTNEVLYGEVVTINVTVNVTAPSYVNVTLTDPDGNVIWWANASLTSGHGYGTKTTLTIKWGDNAKSADVDTEYLPGDRILNIKPGKYTFELIFVKNGKEYPSGKKAEIYVNGIRLSASPTEVIADGIQYTTIVATLRNKTTGQPVSGEVVNFGTTLGTFSTDPTSWNGETTSTTDSNGDATIYLRSDTTGTATVTAIGGGFSDTITIKFVPPTGAIKLTATKDKIYANGSDYTIITAQLVDANGNPIERSGVPITFYVETGGPVTSGDLNTTSATTDSSGKAVVRLNASTKSGVATVVAMGDGKTGKINITLLQAVNETNSQFVEAPSTMLAGKAVKVVYQVKDYDNKAISGAKVKFNISGGDGWFEVNGVKVESPYTVTTDSSGNATIYVNSTNATNNNQITIEVYYINETGKWDRDDSTLTITVNPNVVYRIAIYRGSNEVTGYAFPEGYSQTVTFNVKYLDAFGNVNTSDGTVKIIPQKALVGEFGITEISLTNGNGSVTFRPNASAKVGDSYTFTFNDTTFKTGNVSFTIAVSGIEGIYVSFNESSYTVGETVKVFAQLKGINNMNLPKSGVNVTFIIKGPGKMLINHSLTNGSGVANTTFTVDKAGKWTVTAVNGSVSGVNETIVAGNATDVLLSPLSAKVVVNTTVEFSVTAIDKNGYPTMSPETSVTFIVEKDTTVVNITTVELKDGSATFSYNFTEEGTYKVVVRYNDTIFNESTIIVTSAKPDLTVESINVTPESPVVNETVTVKAKIANVGDADAGAFNVSLYADGSLVDTKSVKSLAAGNSTTVEFSWTPDKAKIYVLKVVVDTDNAVKESNENNNEKTESVTVKSVTGIQQTIEKYYSGGNANSKNDVLQAIINAINDYFSAPSDKKTEILNDIIAMINHYFTLS